MLSNKLCVSVALGLLKKMSHVKSKFFDSVVRNITTNTVLKKTIDPSRNNTSILEVGDTVSVNKLISITDIDDFCELTGDYNTVHKEMRIVHGALLNALVASVIGNTLPGPGTLVVSERLDFPNSCIAPTNVTVKVTITSVRKLIGCDFECHNLDGLLVLRGDARLIKKKKS